MDSFIGKQQYYKGVAEFLNWSFVSHTKNKARH